MSTRDRRTVGDVMTTQVATLEAGERLDLAEDIMHVGRIRHMPVVEGKRLVGIVSVRDLLSASLSQVMEFEPSHRRAFLRSVSADEAMTPNPVTVGPDTPLATAAERLCEQKIGCLPVVDAAGELVGILTETDLVRAAWLDEPEGRGAAALDQARRNVREFSERFRGELEGLAQTRDELRVRVHLGKAEAQDRWRELEKKWQELERRAKSLGEEAREPLHDVREAAENLAEEIRRGYRKLRGAIGD